MISILDKAGGKIDLALSVDDRATFVRNQHSCQKKPFGF